MQNAGVLLPRRTPHYHFPIRFIIVTYRCFCQSSGTLPNIPARIFRFAYNARLRQRVSSSPRKEYPVRANRAIKINTRSADRIDLLFVHDLHRPSLKRAAASVRYARMHVNGRRGYRARGSKLKLKRIHRESFPVARVIRARTVLVYLPFCSFVRAHRAAPGTAVILRQQSGRVLRPSGFTAREYLRFSN